MELPVRRKRGRPPRRLDGGLETRQALVRAGVALLTEQGFCATGIDEVLSRVGVPKGSFYHYFTSKEAFGAELIDSYATYFDHKLQRWLGDRRRPAVQNRCCARSRRARGLRFAIGGVRSRRVSRRRGRRGG